MDAKWEYLFAPKTLCVNEEQGQRGGQRIVETSDAGRPTPQARPGKLRKYIS